MQCLIYFAVWYRPMKLLNQAMCFCSIAAQSESEGNRVRRNCTGVVTTAGTVFARILMGNICDLYGPRYGMRLLWRYLDPASARMPEPLEYAVKYLFCPACMVPFMSKLAFLHRFTYCKTRVTSSHMAEYA